MTPMERTAGRLKKLREARGLTQQELAGKAGISREYLARLEAGSHDPTLSVLERLARALRVRTARLL